jgi:symplekin
LAKNYEDESYLEKFLKNEDHLNIFLRVLTPDEIFYRSHYFKEIKNSLNVTQLCMNNTEIFNEHVMLYVISRMEGDTLPPLFMRTVILSLINFPNLKKFVTSLMFRLGKRKVWTSARMFEGFVKCLDVLGSSGVEIVMTLPEEQIEMVFSKSKRMLDLCDSYVKSQSSLKGRYVRILKNILKTKK